jgi:hypothetical protein
MNWRRRRRNPEVDTSHRDAKKAFAEAIEARQRAERTAAAIEPVMDQLRKRREVNHFTELFEVALRGGSKDDK